ncbi:MAG: 3-keto-5-aminohexanoate cleavage protein [Paracoccaceae bacterium]
MTLPVLPNIMVAPNGARRGYKDHPALPVTDDDIVANAKACFAAGADGIHLHIRDTDGLHLLDAGRYQTLLDRVRDAVPDLYLQVTSEAAGRYDTATQQQIIRELRPAHVSVAMREMVRDPTDWPAATAFYEWAEQADVHVQHIVYSAEELGQFIAACDAGHIPGKHHLMQLVLGTYDGTQISRPSALKGFVDQMAKSDLDFDWMLCAFGKEETDCLVEAARLGGKARVGFENSLWHADGSVAQDNAARVRTVSDLIQAL